MSEFLYLYRIGAEAQREAMGTPGHAEKSMKIWLAWMRELEQDGHLKSPGQPLELTGKVVGGKQRAVTDGPFVEVKDLVAGFTLIEARDLDEAVRLVRRLPDPRGRWIGRGQADPHGREHVIAPTVDLDEQLFRRESGRLVSALTRIFGVHNLALAEDVAQDAFVRALEVWKVRGRPDNPAAWLMTTAKNRALDVIRRERSARTFAPEVTRLLETEWTIAPVIDEAFALHVIRDEQLRMMFSCCDPHLPEEVQVALVLNILCGFGAPAIASAFLSSRAAIEKRITRGKKALASSERLFDLADGEFVARLSGCSVPSTCSSTRAITPPRVRRRCAPSSAGKRCASPASCWSTHLPPRRPRTRSPP